MKRQILMAGACAGLALAAAGAAQAQSIDYGSLQQMFNEPVTTSATGSPQRSTDAPVDMTIISAEDIHRSGTTDLPTILSRVAGVDILNYAAAQSDVGIRGYDQGRSPRLLVLINGRQVYLDHQGYTDWNALPVQLSEIRQIEVVRGPNSAIFGFNAVSGVVNIITYNPKFDDTNVVDVRYGTAHSSNLSLVKTLHLGDRVSVRLSGGVERMDQWRRTNGLVATSAIVNPLTSQANLDANVQLAPKMDLRIEGSWSGERETQPISIFSLNAYRVKTDSGKATLTDDTSLGLIQAQVYRNDVNAITPGPRIYANSITVASVQDLFKIGAANTFRVGLEYRDNRMDTASFSGALLSYKVWAPSAMWSWTVNPKLAVTVALREDILKLKRSGPFPVGDPINSNALWDKSLPETSANLGLVYKLSPKDSLLVTYARGVQAPTLLELGGLIIPPATPAPVGSITSGSPNVAPSIVTNFEAAYDRDLPSLNARASAKVFVQKTQNVKAQSTPVLLDIHPTLTTYGVALYQNVGDSEMAGFELAASGKVGRGFHWSADTTYTQVTNKPTVSANELILRKMDFAATTPKFRGNLAAGWANKQWSADAYLHYVTKFSTYNGNLLEAVPAYASLAGRVGYRFSNGIEMALNGENLLTDRQSQAKGPSGLQAERKVQFSLSKAW